MTDKEIIKALECCVNGDCDNCPNCIGMFCIVNLESYALDLINRQQEQLEATIAGQETLQKALAKKDKELMDLNINLELLRIYGNKNLSYKIATLTAEKNRLTDMFGEHRKEAIRALDEKDIEIERLTAEKEQLIKTFGECQEEATKALAEKDKEIKRLNNNISAMAVTMHNCAKATRAEAIRAFAERLKTELSFGKYIQADQIDNLVKEMAGDAE